MMQQGQQIICLEYVLGVLLGLDQKHLQKHIAYCRDDEPLSDDIKLCIVDSGFFCENYGTLESLPLLPIEQIEKIPLLFGCPEIKTRDGKLIVYADIIASAYFLVTRYEEMVRCDVRDEYGRFLGVESLPYRAGFLDRPIVDEYADLLRKWLRQTGLDVPEPDRKFSVLLTHDVDVVRKHKNIFNPLHMLTILKNLLRGKRPPWNIFKSIAVSLRLIKDPYVIAFEEMLKLDNDFQQRANNVSANAYYFFMAPDNKLFTRRYNIRSWLAKGLLKSVIGAQAVVGLHPDLETSINPEQIVRDKELLEKACGFKIRHSRHHYLAWRGIGDGWSLVNAGIEWDSSLGYADVAGFRLGVCRGIPLFDPAGLKPFGIEEHPLIVMDCTLSDEKYMNLGQEEAFEYCKKLIDQTRKHNGQFVMLWHNTVFVRKENNYHPQLYKDILKQLGIFDSSL